MYPESFLGQKYAQFQGRPFFWRTLLFRTRRRY